MGLGLSISLLSATALGYEVLLTRLFSIIQWHHFAYMVISLALLGFGASGTLLSVARSFLLRHASTAYLLNGILFALCLLISFSLGQRLPFNPLEMGWDPRQWLYLFELYLLLMLPFFFAANCIGLALTRWKEKAHRIYQWDLMGAGLGALGIILLLFMFFPNTCLKILSGSALLATLLATFDRFWEGRRYRAWLTIGILLPLPIFWPGSWTELKLSPYKELNLALLAPGARILTQRSSPLGLLTVVESHAIPFRYAPGLSLNSALEPPPQLGLFTDGDSLSAITAYHGNLKPMEYLDFMSPALPYHLLDRPEVLILGAGGGAEILLARYHHAPEIEVVEINRQVIDLVKNVFRNFAGPLYDGPELKIQLAEGRGFVSRGKEKKYDLIQLSLLDSFSATSAGLYALGENYLYTVEALQDFLARLKPGGMLSITRWLQLPPRDSLKLFATAVLALERNGVGDPAKRLALIRSWKTTTLLVKNGDLTPEEIEKLRSFTLDRSFDVAYYPGMSADEANRFNRLPSDYFYAAALALLGDEREKFLEDYKFEITPATDDRPFFFHSFKWETFREILALGKQGGLPLLEWGYPLLIATLLQALLASFLFILLPLLALSRQRLASKGIGLVSFYFFALGLAFLFIEMAFIQRFILFLSHPLYAISVVLSAFLVFAGLGSGISEGLAKKIGRNRGPDRIKALGIAVAGILLVGALYHFTLQGIFHRFISWSDPGRIALTILLIAPFAFFMGMPFPLGLMEISQNHSEWIPLAWGINGCASVLSAILATLLAIHSGFSLVIVLALILYALAWLCLFSFHRHDKLPFPRS